MGPQEKKPTNWRAWIIGVLIALVDTHEPTNPWRSDRDETSADIRRKPKIEQKKARSWRANLQLQKW